MGDAKRVPDVKRGMDTKQWNEQSVFCSAVHSQNK